MSFLYLSKPSRIKLEDLFSYGLDIFGIFSGTNAFFKNTSAMELSTLHNSTMLSN